MSTPNFDRRNCPTIEEIEKDVYNWKKAIQHVITHQVQSQFVIYP